jgi:hypothetical protein
MRKATVATMVVALAAIGLLASGCAEGTSGTSVTTTPVTYPQSSTTSIVETAEFIDTGCVSCHTDEEAVKALAVEEEEKGESLSEGEG